MLVVFAVVVVFLDIVVFVVFVAVVARIIDCATPIAAGVGGISFISGGSENQDLVARICYSGSGVQDLTARIW